MTSISTLSNPTAQAEIAEALNQSVAETAVTTMLAVSYTHLTLPTKDSV